MEFAFTIVSLSASIFVASPLSNDAVQNCGHFAVKIRHTEKQDITSETKRQNKTRQVKIREKRGHDKTIHNKDATRTRAFHDQKTIQENQRQEKTRPETTIHDRDKARQ